MSVTACHLQVGPMGQLKYERKGKGRLGSLGCKETWASLVGPGQLGCWAEKEGPWPTRLLLSPSLSLPYRPGPWGGFLLPTLTSGIRMLVGWGSGADWADPVWPELCVCQPVCAEGVVCVCVQRELPASRRGVAVAVRGHCGRRGMDEGPWMRASQRLDLVRCRRRCPSWRFHGEDGRAAAAA